MSTGTVSGGTMPSDRYDIGAHSPCIGVCDLSPATGICLGCARTGAEIADWPGSDAEFRGRVWASLPERAAQLGLDRRVMPWSPAGILHWAADTFRHAAHGAWFIGRDRSATAFRTRHITPHTLVEHDGGFRVERGSHVFALTLHDKLRVFAFGPADRPHIYVLTLPKGRVTIVGADRPGFIGSQNAAWHSFDLATGTGGVRQTLSVAGESPVAAKLAEAARSPCTDPAKMDLSGAVIVTESTCAMISRPFDPHGDSLDGLTPTVPDLDQVELPGWAAVVAIYKPGS